MNLHLGTNHIANIEGLSNLTKIKALKLQFESAAQAAARRGDPEAKRLTIEGEKKIALIAAENDVRVKALRAEREKNSRPRPASFSSFAHAGCLR